MKSVHVDCVCVLVNGRQQEGKFAKKIKERFTNCVSEGKEEIKRHGKRA